MYRYKNQLNSFVEEGGPFPPSLQQILLGKICFPEYLVFWELQISHFSVTLSSVLQSISIRMGNSKSRTLSLVDAELESLKSAWYCQGGK